MYCPSARLRCRKQSLEHIAHASYFVTAPRVDLPTEGVHTFCHLDLRFQPLRVFLLRLPVQELVLGPFLFEYTFLVCCRIDFWSSSQFGREGIRRLQSTENRFRGITWILTCLPPGSSFRAWRPALKCWTNALCTVFQIFRLLSPRIETTTQCRSTLRILWVIRPPQMTRGL